MAGNKAAEGDKLLFTRSFTRLRGVKMEIFLRPVDQRLASRIYQRTKSRPSHKTPPQALVRRPRGAPDRRGCSRRRRERLF